MFNILAILSVFTLVVFQSSWIFQVAAVSETQYLHDTESLQPQLSNDFHNTGFGNTRTRKRGNISSSVGLGDFNDLMYTVPIRLGNRMFAVHLDTGSSDLWVISDRCTENACKESNISRFPDASFVPAGVDVEMHYGDSTTGTYASGSVGLTTASVAGITIAQQTFALIDDTTNHVVEFNAAGILGLSFPSASKIQEEMTATVGTGPLVQTDHFVESTDISGPLLSRMAMSGALELPMFSVEFQRVAIDISGNGSLTIGKLPDGIENSSLTWVPVRLYPTEDGGLAPPSSAPDEVYPFRWEVDIDGVFLDGKRFTDSAIPADDDVDSQRVSALIDTGNSLLRGPEDVVKNILSSVSTTYDPDAPDPVAALPCNIPHSLAFQIGGKMFPIDPRDFISQLDSMAVVCQADNLVATDPPSVGSLFRWSLGTPFFRSNLVAFYYGNLTHPSMDPPRIGFLSVVPKNADQLLQDAIQKAMLNGGNFPNSVEPAPTASASQRAHITVSAGVEYISSPTSTQEQLSQSATDLVSTSFLSTPTASTNGKAASAGVSIALTHGYLLLFCLQSVGLLSL
ncbi:hypothetical protein GALMADRAFT_87852 [Galerina marginata CBS 339.88]|uniref:Peptidase A1 domain-containing protein n=1 Tax=Galerina marginata (strain CBS 339.88) TaxID=685588 RepID=A0A067TRJ2_GALM3|nr:hypothetical protein GALMADRAFT_87852 [Galerina marginata CBS 339.88]